MFGHTTFPVTLSTSADQKFTVGRIQATHGGGLMNEFVFWMINDSSSPYFPKRFSALNDSGDWMIQMKKTFSCRHLLS